MSTNNESVNTDIARGFAHIVASGQSKGVGLDVIKRAFEERKVNNIEAYLEQGVLLAKTKGATIDPRRYLGPAVVDAFSAAFGTTKASTFVHAAEVMSRKPGRVVINGLCVERTVNMLFAAPNRGKSFVVQDLAVAVASGKSSWLGRRLRIHGPVAMLTVEGVSMLPVRLKAFYKYHHAAPDIPLYVRDIPTRLQEVGDVDGLVNELKPLAPVLMIIDTLSANASGVKENDTEEMSVIVEHCQRLCRELGATVLIVHHSSKGNEANARGASALLASVDTAWLLNDLRGSLSLSVVKARHFDKDSSQVLFKLRQVEMRNEDGEVDSTDDDGQPNTTCVIDVLNEQQEIDEQDAFNELTRRVLVVLDDTPKSLRVILREMQQTHGESTRRSALKSALDVLVTQKMAITTPGRCAEDVEYLRPTPVAQLRARGGDGQRAPKQRELRLRKPVRRDGAFVGPAFS